MTLSCIPLGMKNGLIPNTSVLSLVIPFCSPKHPSASLLCSTWLPRNSKHALYASFTAPLDDDDDDADTDDDEPEPKASRNTRQAPWTYAMAGGSSTLSSISSRVAGKLHVLIKFTQDKRSLMLTTNLEIKDWCWSKVTIVKNSFITYYGLVSTGGGHTRAVKGRVRVEKKDTTIVVTSLSFI